MRKKKYHNFMLFAFILIITIIIVEIIALSIEQLDNSNITLLLQKSDISYHKSSKNPVLSYEIKSNYYVNGDKVTNNFGFRDIDRELKTSKFRICVIGDSITFGAGLQAQDAYPSLIEQKLNSKGYDVEVWNMGVHAYNSIQKNILVKKAVEEYDADLIIYQVFNDDFWPTGLLYDNITHPASENLTVNEIKAFSQYFKSFMPLPISVNRFLLENSA
ncbi:hypothetical protein KY334_05865, partial [Candidatus Woesearchaeota archaeon]|nr:hypothetical protein [Candidatus Woesearchaeota archaeon]